MSREKAKTICGTETVSVVCRCGKIHVVENIAHYDHILVSCGAPYFAVRPMRFGPLKLVPWAGPNLTRQEYREKYGSDE